MNNPHVAAWHRVECCGYSRLAGKAINTPIAASSVTRVVGKNDLGRRRIDSSELLLVLTCCLTQFATCRIVRRGQRNVTRQIITTTRKELVEALRLRNQGAAFSDRIKMLDELVALTCY